MNKLLIFFVLLPLIGFSTGPARGQPYAIHGVVGTGGGMSSSASFRLVSTLGQPVAGSADGLRSGYWTWMGTAISTGVEDEEDAGPQRPEPVIRFRLDQGYPNPFASTTVIGYALAEPSYAELLVYNMLGQRVRTLVAREHPAGVFRVIWDGRGDAARRLASGLYLLRLEAGSSVQARTVLLVR